MIALSSCEAEYIAESYVGCQSLWLEALLEEIMIEVRKLVQLMVDNKSAIDLAKNLVFHGMSKHKEKRFHFLRDQVNKGKLELVYCPT